jgi:hypothetical protein
VSELAGYEVLIFEHGSWNSSWDGTVWCTKKEAETSCAEAVAEGYKAKVATLRVPS